MRSTGDQSVSLLDTLDNLERHVSSVEKGPCPGMHIKHHVVSGRVLVFLVPGLLGFEYVLDCAQWRVERSNPAVSRPLTGRESSLQEFRVIRPPNRPVASLSNDGRVNSGTVREHRRRQAETRLGLGAAWQDYGLVFCRADGRPIDPGTISQRWHRILDKAGLSQIRVHDLRHTAASLHLARGENPKVVQELLGHSTIAVTMDIYSHVTPTMHAAAASKMQALFADVR